MTIEELKIKAQAEGGYQDIIIGGEVIHKGWRECAERWEMIKNAVGTGKTIIDIGSHYGYFSMRSADAGNLVLSIEGSSVRAEIQKEILTMTNERNVYLLQRQMSFADWFGLYRTTEAIDTILALAVLHYTPPDELFDTLWLFSQIAPNLIVEFPPKEETQVASHANVMAVDNFVELLKTFYSKVVSCGTVQSSGNKEVNRTIYHCYNPKVYRHSLSGYLSHKVGGKKHRITFFEGKWTMDERGIVPAFNSRTLLELPELIYPLDYTERITSEYHRLIRERNGNMTDINFRNALIIRNGVKVIDTDEYLGQDIYGQAWEQWQNTIMGWDINQIKEYLIKGKL